MSTPKKRIWVTGSTGFIGRALVARWSAERADFELVPIRRQRGEVSAEALRRLREELPPDLIVHLATRFQNAYEPADSERILDANVRFPVRILEACRDLPALAFLNFGTFYSHADGGADRPATFYAATKRAFESFLEFYFAKKGWRATTLKLYDTYGPGDTRPKLIPKWMEILRTGKPMDLSPGHQKISLLHVADVVAAATISADRLLSGGEGQGHRSYQLPAVEKPEDLPELIEVARVFEKAAGRALPARFGALPYREGEIMRPWMEFPVLPGWRPCYSLEEGFRTLF